MNAQYIKDGSYADANVTWLYNKRDGWFTDNKFVRCCHHGQL